MTVEIKYKDLIDRCEQLSSFESEGKADAAGQSRYLEIHINEVDKLLIMQYINQARALIEERFERMILDASEENKEETVITVLPDTREVLPFDGWINLDEFKEENEITGSFIDGSSYIGVLPRGSSQRRRDEFIEYAYTDEVLQWKSHWDPRYSSREYVFQNSTDDKKYEWDSDLTEITPYTQRTKTETITRHYFTWLIRTDTRWKENASFSKHVSEAIVAYTMSAWLSDKLPERVAFYDALFTASTEMAVKNIFKKQVPRYEE